MATIPTNTHPATVRREAKPLALLHEIKPLLRRPAVEQATGDSRSTIYRKIKAGLLTKPIDIGGDRVAWPAHEIAAINTARIAGKSEDEIKILVVQLEAARTEESVKQ